MPDRTDAEIDKELVDMQAAAEREVNARTRQQDIDYARRVKPATKGDIEDLGKLLHKELKILIEGMTSLTRRVAALEVAARPLVNNQEKLQQQTSSGATVTSSQ